MEDREIVQRLSRAAYVADGGELPAMESHFRTHRERYDKMTAAILRELSRHTFALRADASGPFVTAQEVNEALLDLADWMDPVDRASRP